MTRDKAKEEIIRLVERFRENLDVYKKGTYNETQLRREFVDPFFEALGWDVTNKSGHAEQYKDVVHEDAVKIGVTTKAPDYSFRVGGQRKFFLETKKPAINIKDDVSPAYQIRRYAWNANLRISILTDFEELAVYDCGIKPNPNDKVSMGRVAFYHFEDYVKKFDEIYDTFSKEAVWKGAFDRYAGEGKKGKKGTETVDKEFLKEIERWRELLAKNIAVNNSNLDVYALNFSVQQTIDRIVFLRICEDRGMENYGQLQTLLNGASVYKRLFDVFYKADQKYNSGLFDFSEDKLTHSLSIDDKVLKDIIENLYYPKSPYEFAVFDAEILGNVYEQFLGKVIRLTPSHQAKVEEKPEVKKAGGVYYTPKYIVDYIVANTVGKLLGDISGGSESPFPLEGSVSGHTGGGEGGISPSPLEGEGRGEGLNSYNPRFIQLARNLRKNQTDAEKLMWLLVRNNQLGAKFRRQQPIGKYIADFYCSEKKLAIELDGGKHTESEDRPKTEFLNQAGITVLRFWNSEVLENTEGVLQAIWDKINTPHLNPLPQGERKIFKMTPKQVEKIKILDPACGSGSFLIGAYQYLLDYHLNWYREFEPEKHAKGKKPAVYKGSGGEWRLTTTEKKRILLNNIFGVDIDRQAVEVTKLSLLLKVLEGENEETLGKTFALFQERALPNLESNIKCGNSLIGPDFYDNASSLFPSPLEGEGRVRGKEGWGEGEMDRINVFDWNDDEKGFGKIMKDGGFDCVVGNPPYVRIQAMKEWAPIEVEEYKKRYESASKGNYDIYIVFIEKGLSLLNKEGLLGFICPHKFFQSQYGEPLRRIISKGKHLSEVVDFTDQQVFAGATTYTCLLFLNKSGVKGIDYTEVKDLQAWQASEDTGTETGKIPASYITSEPWNFVVGKGARLFEKLSKMPIKLADVAQRIFQGLVTGVDPVFVLAVKKHKSKTLFVFSKALQREIEIEKDIVRPLLKGAEIHTYFLDNPDNVILFPYTETSNGIHLYSDKELKSIFPLAWCYLNESRSILEAREGGKWKVSNWWQFGRNQNIAEMTKTKILTQVLAKQASFTYDQKGEYCFVGGGNAGGYGLYVRQETGLSNKFVIGLLNSNLLDTYLKSVSTPFRGGFYSYAKRFIELLPMPNLNLSHKNDKSLHDKMVALVDNMLELNKKLPKVKTPHERELLERQIKITDNQIDRLVYELYALTEEEIKVVEGK